MSIRAEWRLNELLGCDDDPFSKVILSSGLHVDLTGSEEEIFAGLSRSLELEARLFNRGVTCDLKDGGEDCLTCPMYAADREEEPRAPLCRLGRDQRLLETRCGELTTQRLAEPFAELAEAVDEFAEMAEAPPEYAELLTAVGL